MQPFPKLIHPSNLTSIQVITLTKFLTEPLNFVTKSTAIAPAEPPNIFLSIKPYKWFYHVSLQITNIYQYV